MLSTIDEVSAAAAEGSGLGMFVRGIVLVACVLGIVACSQGANRPVDGGATLDAPGADAPGTPDAGPTGGPRPCSGALELDPALFPVCDLCPNARCVPASFVPAGQADLLGPCDATSYCVPDDLLRYLGNVLLETCTSVQGAEGRCVSTCVPSVASQADFLPRDICRDGEICAPCFDPITGEDTGACSLGCDPGPTEPPVTFPPCCGGNGACVPSSLVPPDQQSLLGADSCTGTGELCVPGDLADSSFQPMGCSSVGGFEGRCLPECLPDVAAQAGLLPRDICDAGYLCTPCYDPITLAATGACDLNGDMPDEPPMGFAKCCGGLGSCVPSSIVPADQQSLLGTDSCATAGTLCAPDALADTSYRPPACDSIGGFEGRCMPACLPDIAAQADRLPQGGCAAGHLCAPCYDPITGVATGACALNGDTPTTPGSDNRFPRCCMVSTGAQKGVCVPESLIPAAQLSQVPRDTCASGQRCVPETQASDPDAAFPRCNVGSRCVDDGNFLIGSGQFISGTNSGVCLPECMMQTVNPDGPVPENAQNGRRDCAAGDVCVACTIRMCIVDGCALCGTLNLGTCNTGACGGTGDCE